MERRPKTPAGLRTWLLLPWAEPLGSCLPSGGPTQDDKHLGETECSGLRLGGPGPQRCAGGCVSPGTRGPLSACPGRNTLLELMKTLQVQLAFQRHPVLSACRAWGPLTRCGGGPEVLDAFYWWLYPSLPSVSARLMDGAVNMLILRKHNFLNFPPPRVSGNLSENLVGSYQKYKEEQAK